MINFISEPIIPHMFEIIFDSVRDDFTPEHFEELYRRNMTKLKEVIGPTKFRFTKNLEVDLRRIIKSEDFRDVHELIVSISDAFDESYNLSRFLIALPQDSDAARLSLKNNPNAKWGGVIGSCGFVYGPVTDELILHETLHIFDADDCYMFSDVGFNDLTCGHSNCIMQYDPNKASLQSQEWICQPNVRKIQNRLKSC
ncbi:MAG: hypothetical protein ACOCUT_03160 [bacterium]